LRALVGLAPDPTLVVDPGYTIVALNEQAAELFGHRLETLRGRPVEDVLTLPAGTGPPVECAGRAKDGQELPVEATLGPAPGGHTVVALRALRRRKRDEAALREAGQRFQRVFADGPVAMALVGDDYRFAEVNEAFCRLTGYDADELAELSFTDITHPADRDVDLRLARDVFGGEIQGYTLDKRYVRKDGEVIWISLTVSVIRDDDGRPLKGMGLVQDITERRRALESARTELGRLGRDRDRILELAGEGIYHADERGRITFANPAAAELLGWPQDELIGKPAHELLHHTRPDGRHYPRERCPIHGPEAAEEPLESAIDDVFWRRDGSRFPVHWRSTPVPGPGGAVVVFSDLSGRVSMERAMQAAGERAARERLQAAEAERARWARELHDETMQGLAALHVLLSPPSGGATLEEMAGRIRVAQEQIENEMEKLRGLISELRPAALDQLGLEASVRDLAERTEAIYGLDVETRFDLGGGDGAPRRLASEVETAAYRIVQECLSNAARHADATRVEVELTQRNGSLSVRVGDDGNGFDPGSESAGYGLRGMRERVDLLDGSLTVESERSRGTEVSAALPLI
ncbi:MAG TPA: PAS domain S-box protein, partial [Thermoleophilaceae bacterium]|nr:PAS domain S-box protein [Thermoleophilaceae bacterium]